MARKSPGIDPLGHSPFSRVKLEGPKVHHDFHGSDDSVPAKGERPAVPNEHWEMQYKQWEPSRNMILTEGADFNPKCPQDRKTTHLKVNETDH